jgi:integrase
MAEYTRERTNHPGVYRYMRDGEWVSTKVSYRVGTKQIEKTLPGPNTITQAVQWKAREVTGKDTSERIDPASGRVTLEELYKELHERVPYAPKTKSQHADIWRKAELDALKRLPVNKVTSTKVERALAQIQAAGMRQEARKLLSRLFTYAMTQRGQQNVALLWGNPAKQAGRKKTRSERIEAGASRKKHRRLNTEELARLIAEVPDRDKTLVHVMARVGLRPGEAFALTVGQFDPLKRTLEIDRAVSDGLVGPTKTGEHRSIVLPAAIADELVAHVARYSNDSDPQALVFPAERGSMMNAHNWRERVFRPASERAGVNHGLSPNDLRHTAVAWAISLGADVYTVQRMVGHAKPSITLDVYGYLWDSSQQQLADRMDEAIRSEKAPEDGKVVALPQAAGEDR